MYTSPRFNLWKTGPSVGEICMFSLNCVIYGSGFYILEILRDFLDTH